MSDPNNERQQIQLPTGELCLFENANLRYNATIPMGVEPSELLNPAFWAHHASRLRPYDEIRALAQDGTWVAEYVVLTADRTWARVKQTSFTALSTTDVALTQASQGDIDKVKSAHVINWGGEDVKWRVVRRSDKATVRDGMEKDMAVAWLEAYAREQAAAPQAETVAA